VHAVSKSGFWLEWKRAGLYPDSSLLQAYTRVLREAKPRAFILENVYTLTYKNKASRPAYERLLREIYGAGYNFDAKVLNAADYGVPQVRPRLFIVGVRRGWPVPELPEPTHTGMWERRMSGAGTTPHSRQARLSLALRPSLNPPRYSAASTLSRRRCSDLGRSGWNW